MARPTGTPARTGARGFGIDIGGSGVKGAPVDLDTGALAGERVRLAQPQPPTPGAGAGEGVRLAPPHPSTPDAVAKGVAEIVGSFGWDGPIGVTVPAVVTNGV